MFISDMFSISDTRRLEIAEKIRENLQLKPTQFCVHQYIFFLLLLKKKNIEYLPEYLSHEYFDYIDHQMYYNVLTILISHSLKLNQ